MSDDLVKELRSSAAMFYEYAADDGAFLREAPDRIESSEAAYRRHANDDQYTQIWDGQFRAWVQDVLLDNGRLSPAALGGKKNES